MRTILPGVGRSGERDLAERSFACQGYTMGGMPLTVTQSRAHIRAVQCPERCQGCKSRSVCSPPLPNKQSVTASN